MDLFFVLSGFLITSILVGEHDTTGGIRLKRFYLRRALRLMPAFVSLLAFTTLLGFLSKSHLGNSIEAGFFAVTYTMNWYRAFGGGHLWLLGHTWSLAIEEQFYLVWPVALLAIKARHRALVVFTLICAVIGWRCWMVAHGASTDRIYYGFDTRADALLIGCLLAVSPGIFPKHGFACIVAISVIVLGSFQADRDGAFTQIIGMPAIALATAVLIAGLISGNVFARLLSFPPLVFTGRISYGLYLWHLPIFNLFLAKFSQPPIAILLVLTYGVAVTSFFLIERPILRIKDRLATDSRQPSGHSTAHS